jgi:hypothetical protein
VIKPGIVTTETMDHERLQRLIERSRRILSDALIALNERGLVGGYPDGPEVSAAELHAALERSADNWNMGGEYLVHEMLGEAGRKL